MLGLEDEKARLNSVNDELIEKVQDFEKLQAENEELQQRVKQLEIDLENEESNNAYYKDNFVPELEKRLYLLSEQFEKLREENRSLRENKALDQQLEELMV